MTSESEPTAITGGDKELYLRFHGRVLEHLGIQMYQNPVDAVAELIANAWDANAEHVHISLPSAIGNGGSLIVQDDGAGMTFAECQNFFLEVGRNRRGSDPDEKTKGKNRPVLGRKGIGKFAGFGIAELVTVSTVSQDTGEKTVFQLDLNQLLEGDYASVSKKPIGIVDYQGPSDTRKAEHGTTLTLARLTIDEVPESKRFARAMARRFLLHQSQSDFAVEVDGEPLPSGLHLTGAEYVFPRDYQDGEKPAGLSVDEDGWGEETLPNGESIQWRFVFHKDTIDEEELRGIAVYAKNKLAQRPFLFLTTKGLEGQHGTEYLSGQVKADYIDQRARDLIATERQRINWNHPDTRVLLEWGQARLRALLKLWAGRRAQKRVERLEKKVARFSERLNRLEAREAKTVKRALKQLAQISTLTNAQFDELGEGVLTSWEHGRLRSLIDEIAEKRDLTQADLLEILLEAKVLTALNTAEAVLTKLRIVKRLKRRIEAGQLENAVRDFIAENPWLISPKWETFRVERSVKKLMSDAANTAGLDVTEGNKRIDLALASGDHLLILEFMRPGKKIDLDHLNRFESYIDNVRRAVEATTAGRFKEVTGYLVADKILNADEHRPKIRRLAEAKMFVMDWQTLLENAAITWKELLDVLTMRSPDDLRLKSLLETLDDLHDVEDEPIGETVDSSPPSEEGVVTSKGFDSPTITTPNAGVE